jgi:Ca2+-binding EF-hand superfamily protein
MAKDKSEGTCPPRAKKSETLEVRIPFETKQAFLTACREDGTTASEVVRESVRTYLDRRERPCLEKNGPQKEKPLIMKFPEPVRRYGFRAAAGGLAAVGLTTFAALPSAAAPDFAAIFKKMDANGDGVLSTEEFLAHREGGNQVKIESKIEKTLSGDQTSAVVHDGQTEIKQDAYAFWLPDENGGEASQQMNAIHSQEIRIERRSSSDASGAPPSPPQHVNVMESAFKSFDADGNGKVSLAEFQGRHRAMLTRGFEVLDSNKDGSLSAMEYAQIANPPLPQLANDPAVPAVPATPAIPGAPKMTPDKLQASFAKLDANKDNKLSLQEYLPPA